MDLLIQVFLIIIFILAAGLFSVIEISIASFGKNKIEELRENSPRLASEFDKIRDNLNAFFGTSQILTTVFNTSAILITFHLFFNKFSQWLLNQKIAFLSGNSSILAAIISVALVTLLVLVFSILIPKAIGFKYSDRIGRSSVKTFLLVISIFKYPVELTTRLGNLFLRPFNERTNFSQTRLSEDEIRIIISDGVKSGALDEAEKQIIENIFEFNDLKANEVMIPRTDVKAVELKEDHSRMAKEAIESGFSLVPVYEGSLDNIIGVLHTKDFIKSFWESSVSPPQADSDIPSGVEQKPVVIKSLIRQAYFVPETKLISEILREMQKRGERLAIVTDEYGGTEGLVTMQDILEEIVGEIKDENKIREKDFTKLPDGSFSVLGSMGIDDFNETFNVELPVSDNYNTVAGFVSDISGKILNRGEEADFENIKFELVKKIRQKMVQFKVYSNLTPGEKQFGIKEESKEN